jgi:hypothetical protein
VTVAAVSGTVSRGGEIRIASRSEFAPSADITFQNLTVTGNSIRESPCGINVRVANNTLIDSNLDICAGSDGGGNVRR